MSDAWDREIWTFAHGLIGEKRDPEAAWSYAVGRAEALRKCGDSDGHHVWLRVAEAVDEIAERDDDA